MKVNSGMGVPDDQWNHVAYTRNGNLGYFYVNGLRCPSPVVGAGIFAGGGNLELPGVWITPLFCSFSFSTADASI